MIFPFNSQYLGNEVSSQSTGQVSNAVLAGGPWGETDGSYQFSGNANSFIEIANNEGGPLDFETSITILAWVYWEGNAGPIVHYEVDGAGVQLWVNGQNQLTAQFVQRSGAKAKEIVFSGIQLNSWHYVGCSYNYATGEGKLWYDGKAVQAVILGVFKIRTQFSIRCGARVGDQKFYTGRIACLQFYGAPLDEEAVIQIKDLCKGMNAYLKLRKR